jgi:hypothetical protein
MRTLINYDLAKPEDQIEIFEGDALEYLQSIYKGRVKYDAYRFRAANAAVPYERPKLAVAAILHPDGSFAERLEKAISRSQQPMKVINHQPELNQTPVHPPEELSQRPRPPKVKAFIRRI